MARKLNLKFLKFATKSDLKLCMQCICGQQTSTRHSYPYPSTRTFFQEANMSHSLPDIGQAEQESPRNSHSMADQEMDDIVVFSSDNEHARAVELENDDEFLFPNRLRDQPPPPKWKFSFFSSFTKGTFIFVTMLVLGIVAGIIAWIKISLGGSDTGTPSAFSSLLLPNSSFGPTAPHSIPSLKLGFHRYCDPSSSPSI